MAKDVIKVGTPAYTLEIKGIRATSRALKKSGADMQQMNKLMHAIGMIVVENARPRAPHNTGRLAATIRAGRGRTKAVVSAGKKRVPYAGVIHYGWPKRGIAAQPFLTTAIDSQSNRIYTEFLAGLGKILDTNNLENNL